MLRIPAELMLLLILQRYYFESESQHNIRYTTRFYAVAYPTKILFWKRITAHTFQDVSTKMLLLILQRYYFESESQLNSSTVVYGKCCCLSYKDTILKANHSRNHTYKHTLLAVAYPTKILFWKRITAKFIRRLSFVKLLLILQRYYFESESQLGELNSWFYLRCCLSYKDTILKANHSLKALIFLQRLAVAYPTKILFWKRITALRVPLYQTGTLLLILQRYYFESESQLIHDR